MNRHSTITAASTPAVPGALRGYQPARREADGQANLSLPAWADNDEGRALVARIVAERPGTRNYDNGCSAWGGTEYAGKTANALRKLYNRALGEIADEERALFEAGKPYGEAHNRLTALMNGEQPDQLIERVLA